MEEIQEDIHIEILEEFQDDILEDIMVITREGVLKLTSELFSATEVPGNQATGN